LRGANLSEANLNGANLSGANLSGANLNGTFLHNSLIDETKELDDKWRLVWKILNQGATARKLNRADLSLPT
jgi:uncharacterized protein YjbI with pentapeptide repeats